MIRQNGYPDEIVKILKNIVTSSVQSRAGRDLTEWFQTVVRVLQGDALSPLRTLFHIFLDNYCYVSRLYRNGILDQRSVDS